LHDHPSFSFDGHLASIFFFVRPHPVAYLKLEEYSHFPSEFILSLNGYLQSRTPTSILPITSLDELSSFLAKFHWSDHLPRSIWCVHRETCTLLQIYKKQVPWPLFYCLIDFYLLCIQIGCWFSVYNANFLPNMSRYFLHF